MGDEVVTTPFGKFLVNPDECIGGTVKAGTVWDGPGFLQVIAEEHARFGDYGMTILDVGAHLGDWTVWCCTKGAWRVIAVEPAPVMLAYLKANLDLNKSICAEHVIVLPVAAYDQRATLNWTIPYVPRDSGGAALCKDVGGDIEAARLDDYMDLYGVGVSLIKIDAQGCDGRALVGLQMTIEKWHPVIVFEWEEELAKAHQDTLADTIAWLARRGYMVREWPSHPHNFLAVWQR